MIGRNVKHSGVGKWSGNDRGIPAGDGSLHQELLRIAPVLSVMYKREPSVKRLRLSKAIVGNLGCLEYSRRGKGRLSQANIPPSSNDQRRHRN